MTPGTAESRARSEALPSVWILGSRVHLPDPAAVTAWIERRIREWRPGRPCAQIVVTGFHGLWEAHRDKGLRAILNGADLWIPDGIAPVAIARLRGMRGAQRTPGADVMRNFFEAADRNRLSSYFLGDTEETLQALAASLERQYPKHRIAGTYSPPFRALTAKEDEEILRRINRARPDVLWVGLGTPKQDRWISERRDRLQVPVAAGVGAAFGFLSGRVSRAPEWMGRCGLEWAWRMAHEPKKLWRRVLLDGPRFATHACLELTGLRRYE